MMRLREIRESESHVDVTEVVECYAKAKTWDCRCGADMWGYFDTRYKKCHACGVVNVDRRYEDREAPMTEDGQATLGAF